MSWGLNVPGPKYAFLARLGPGTFRPRGKFLFIAIYPLDFKFSGWFCACSFVLATFQCPCMSFMTLNQEIHTIVKWTVFVSGGWFFVCRHDYVMCVHRLKNFSIFRPFHLCKTLQLPRNENSQEILGLDDSIRPILYKSGKKNFSGPKCPGV